MEKIFVKPAPGKKVRDPITKQHLPEAGAAVPRGSYWLRRLAEGDVILKDVQTFKRSNA